MLKFRGLAPALLAALLPWAAALASAPPRPVLMISTDGMRPDAVTEADLHGLRVPNLRRVLAESSYAAGVTGVVRTLTYPSHTTLVTGSRPLPTAFLQHHL